MTEELFHTDQSEVSRRHAVLSEDGDSVWLYLTEPGKEVPCCDVWVFNLPDAPEAPDSMEYTAEGVPPPAPKGIAPDEAYMEVPSLERFRFSWSKDGHAVALELDGKPVAFVQARGKKGHNSFVSEASPWGEPWDESLYEKLFG